MIEKYRIRYETSKYSWRLEERVESVYADNISEYSGFKTDWILLEFGKTRADLELRLEEIISEQRKLETSLYDENGRRLLT
jgi:hypothetical protein